MQALPASRRLRALCSCSRASTSARLFSMPMAMAWSKVSGLTPSVGFYGGNAAIVRALR